MRFQLHALRSLPTTVWCVSALVALVLMSSPVRAQSRQIPGDVPDEEIVLTNVTLHPVQSATIERGYVAFKDGVITSIGEGEYRGDERGRIVIDGNGHHVYPGLISSGSAIGLVEIGAVRATRDQREVGQMTPEVVAITAVNPDSAIIPVTRANGILHALVMPQGGRVAGYASIIRLDGWTTEDLTVKKRAGLVINWPNVRPGSRERTDQDRREFRERVDEAIAELDVLFDEAGAYLALRDDDDSEQPMDLRLQSLEPVLNGDAPLFVLASNAPTIRSALAWCESRDLDVVIFANREVDACAEELASRDIPVVITGIHSMPTRRDRHFAEPFALPSLLHDAGVPFAIASGTGGASNERNLPYHAATAAAYGLDQDRALRSITLDAANILGIGETHGSIEVGKSADLIVTTGDPLEMTTHTIAAWIAGTPVDLNNKHKVLNDKYRRRYDLPGH